MFTIEIHKNISDIEQEHWDALVDDHVFASYGWLKTVEETFIGHIEPHYLVAGDSNRLVGGTVCYTFTATDTVFTLDDHLFGRLKRFASRLGFSFMPTLLCGPVLSSGKHFLICRELTEKKKKLLLEELIKALEQKAMDTRLSLSFLNVLDSEPELMRLLVEKGYIAATLLPMNYLDIKWTSFAEYLNYLKIFSRHIKKSIKREMNKNTRENVQIQELEDVEKCEQRLHELVTDNYYKYNRKPFMFDKTFFRRTKKNLGDEVTHYVAVKNDMIIAVCTHLKRNGTMYVPFIGVDHKAAGNDFTYFYLAYYRPIMDAIESKLTRMYCGYQMYEAKARRGCITCNTYLYYKPFKEHRAFIVKPWFSLVSFWNRHRLPARVKRNLERIEH